MMSTKCTKSTMTYTARKNARKVHDEHDGKGNGAWAPFFLLQWIGLVKNYQKLDKNYDG